MHGKPVTLALNVKENYGVKSTLLNENDVVNFVSIYLEKKGYKIEQKLTTTQRGIDIVAHHPEKGCCCVEAKGATSSKKDSNRYNKEFNSSQVKTHIGVAILRSFQTKQQHTTSLVVIALPNNQKHKAIYLSGPIMDEHEGIARDWRKEAKRLLTNKEEFYL